MDELRIKHKPIAHALLALIITGIVLATYWFLFWQTDAPLVDTTSYIIATVVTVIAALTLFFILRIVILKPDVLYMNEDGFEYNPGGVSSGFITWKNVQEVKHIKIRTSQGGINALVWELTIAIKLKDPGEYKPSSNKLLKPLLQLNTSLYDAHLFVRLSDTGNRLEDVENFFARYGNNNRPLHLVDDAVL
ncbi:MAG: hypothetical protein EOO03_08535 [Chitinophagaceae bacterium]|nr:MAG: hypothetical protein EOO03_08535 [Chitinophagaceae bacterium]